jgi:hypothetical protein
LWQIEKTEMTKVVPHYIFALLLLAVPNRSADVARIANGQLARESNGFLLEVRPRVITAGETAVLRWSIKGATKVMVEEVSKSGRELRKIGTYGGSGSLQVRPNENTTYVVSCEGSTAFSCASVSVRVRVKQN